MEARMIEIRSSWVILASNSIFFMIVKEIFLSRTKWFFLCWMTLGNKVCSNQLRLTTPSVKIVPNMQTQDKIKQSRRSLLKVLMTIQRPNRVQEPYTGNMQASFDQIFSTSFSVFFCSSPTRSLNRTLSTQPRSTQFTEVMKSWMLKGIWMQFGMKFMRAKASIEKYISVFLNGISIFKNILLFQINFS